MSSFNSPFTGNVIVPTDVSYRSITLSANTVLEWPVNGNATPNYAARIMDVTATTGGLILRMPPANQVSVGQDALIRNVGANAFTVADYDGNVIAVVTASSAKYIYITDNADEAGTWGIISFGVGSSAADAASLVGYGLTVIGATLNTAHPVETISSSYTAVATDRAKTFVWTGGAGALTLTSSGTLGNNWFILLRNGGAGTLTISPSVGDQINSAASLALQPADSAIICCSGSAFFTIGIGKSTDFNFSQSTKAVVSGAYTLTATEAANPIQKFTGVLTGNVTVTVPQTIAVYYITNQTDGTGAGYTVTFTTGVAGSASAVVPAGQQVILVCDSSSLYNASTIAAGAVVLSLNDGTVSSPSLNFATELTTGVYRPASGQWAVSILGVQRLLLQASGVTITGNATVTGTTTLSALTASTALALDASKNVVSVTNTGTGNNVLATSPMLTTPNLGTPSAVVLTNATNLPLATGVTGTLPVVNGGTGVTSSTGTGSVVLSSGPTLAAFNATGNVSFDGGTFVFNDSGADKDARFEGDGDPDLLFLDASTDRVGVGTNSPGYKLAVNGDAAVLGQNTLRLQNSDNTNAYALQNGGATGAGNAYLAFVQSGVSERMRLDASGNLGLGVAPSAWSGVVAMQLPTGASLTGFSNTTNLVQNAYYNGSWRYISTASAALAQVTQGAHQWFTAPSGTAGNNISFAQVMTLDASGNLGLGVVPSATTASLFQIANSAVIAWTDNNVAITGNAVYNSAWKYIGTGYATSYKQTGGQHQWSTATSGTAGNNISFTQAMTLDASGNLGIGTTSPGYKLEVIGPSNSYAANFRTNSGTSANDAGVLFINASSATAASRSSQVVLDPNGANGIGGDYAYLLMTGDGTLTLGNQFNGALVFSGSTERMRLDASGNLGIGTSSPGANLQIGASTSGSQVLAFAYSATSAGSIDFRANGSTFGAGWIQHDAASGALRFATAGSERMRITGAGNVVAGASAALATTATDGFLYVPTCAGTPTGTPTTITGMAPIVVNTTNNKLYFYSGGAWRDAGP